MKQETFPGLFLLKLSFYNLCHQSCSIMLDLNANAVSLECKVRLCGGKNIAMSPYCSVQMFITKLSVARFLS